MYACSIPGMLNLRHLQFVVLRRDKKSKLNTSMGLIKEVYHWVGNPPSAQDDTA